MQFMVIGQVLGLSIDNLWYSFFLFLFGGDTYCNSSLLMLSLASRTRILVSLLLCFEFVSSLLLLLVEDSKIRVVIFGCSLSFFNFSKISGFTYHSPSSGSAIVLCIRAFPLACDQVALLVHCFFSIDFVGIFRVFGLPYIFRIFYILLRRCLTS